MSKPIFISRNFVEFGPFLVTEVIDFHGRGILGELDHVREDGQDDWLFITEWIAKGKPAPKAAAKAEAPAAAPAAKKAAAPAPAPAAKAPAAKKAAAKKAK